MKTAVLRPMWTWRLLRDIVHVRQQTEEEGEQPSVSSLITELVERHRDDLEAEAKAVVVAVRLLNR